MVIALPVLHDYFLVFDLLLFVVRLLDEFVQLHRNFIHLGN